MLSPPSDVAIRIMIFNWLRQRFSLVSSVVTAEFYSPIMWALVTAEYCSQQNLFFSITGRLQQNLTIVRDNVETNDCHYTFRLISNSLWYFCVRGNETIYNPAFPNHLQNYACRNTSSPFNSYVNQTFTQQQFLKQAFNIILVNILLSVPHGTFQHRNAVHKLYPVTHTTVKYYQHTFRFCCIFLSCWGQSTTNVSNTCFKSRRMECGPHFFLSQKTFCVSSN